MPARAVAFGMPMEGDNILKRMLLIFNPVAGGGQLVENLYEVIDRFTKGGFEVTVYPTAAQRDAYRIALERGGAFDYLVCSGGDGTLNEVVDAMMLLAPKPTLGYLPCGTTNDFAHTHGIPTDVFLGANAVLEGAPVPIDVGSFGEEFFTYVAAFGLFTDVSYGTPQGLKNLLGHAAYLLEGVKKLAGIQAVRCTVDCDGEIFHGEFILGLVCNSTSVAGFKLPNLDIRLDDGRFEVILLRKPRHFSELPEILAFLSGSGQPGNSFIIRCASHVRVSAEQPMNWALDGEFGGSHTSVDIRVHPKALEIIKPALAESP